MAPLPPTTALLISHLRDDTALANSDEWTDVHCALEYIKRLLDEELKPSCLLYGRGWLQAHYRVSLALAYWRLKEDEKVLPLLEKARELLTEIEEDVTGLGVRLNSAFEATARGQGDRGSPTVINPHLPGVLPAESGFRVPSSSASAPFTSTSASLVLTGSTPPIVRKHGELTPAPQTPVARSPSMGTFVQPPFGADAGPRRHRANAPEAAEEVDDEMTWSFGHGEGFENELRVEGGRDLEDELERMRADSPSPPPIREVEVVAFGSVDAGERLLLCGHEAFLGRWDPRRGVQLFESGETGKFEGSFRLSDRTTISSECKVRLLSSHLDVFPHRGEG
ncbi:hypothetical protein JCM11251_000142 [Rhodosporidiobolus azoricus]